MALVYSENYCGIKKNELASESNLIIYSDEAKNKNAQENVDKVRLYIDQIGKFKKVTIIKRETNWLGTDTWL